MRILLSMIHDRDHSRQDWNEMADILASGCPGLAERLRAAHVSDEHGRCRQCPRCGPGGSKRWPCGLRVLADLAIDRQAPQPRR